MFKIKTKLINLCLTLFAIIILLSPKAALAMQQDIILLYTNDAHCGVNDNLGYAEISQYKKDLLKNNPNVLLVDAGDAIQGAPIGKLSEGMSIINIMNTVGYDFAIPGNHEFDYGVDNFLKLSTKLNCGYYCSNFINIKTHKPYFPAYKIFNFDDKKIALIGVTTPETLTSSIPTYFQDNKGEFIYSFCEDSSGKKLYKNIQQTVDEVHKLGVNYVILIGHLGVHDANPIWSSVSVAENTSGIDAIIDGHSHEVIPSLIVKNKDHKDVIITQTGTKLQNLGKLTINPDGKISTELINKIPDTDPIITNLINKEEAEFLPMLQKKVGTSSVDLTIMDNKTNKRLVRNGETNLGDFVTDAFRTVLNTDVAIMNGGDIRADLHKGVFSYNDILTVFPFGNMCVSMEITGQQLLDALELGASSYPNESGGFFQISGATYEINSTIPSSVVVDDKGDFVAVKGKHRVQNVKINGKPLDINKKYTIGGTAYILKNGGNGMTMFKNGKVLQDEVLSDIDLITQYIQKNSTSIIGETYSNPYGQNRITIIQ